MRTYSNNVTYLSDADLIAAVESRSEDALEELYRRHSPLLRNVIMRIMCNDADVDDVLQDVFIQVWKQAAHFSAEKGSLKAFCLSASHQPFRDGNQRSNPRLE